MKLYIPNNSIWVVISWTNPKPNPNTVELNLPYLRAINVKYNRNKSGLIGFPYIEIDGNSTCKITVAINNANSFKVNFRLIGLQTHILICVLKHPILQLHFGTLQFLLHLWKQLLLRVYVVDKYLKYLM